MSLAELNAEFILMESDTDYEGNIILLQTMQTSEDRKVVTYFNLLDYKRDLAGMKHWVCGI